MFVHFRKKRANIPNTKDNQRELEPAGRPVLVDTMTTIFYIDDMNSVFLVKEVENFYTLSINGKDVITNDTLSGKQGSLKSEYP